MIAQAQPLPSDGAGPGTAAPLLLRVAEVASLLGISIRLVWRLTSMGELPEPVRLSRVTRWRRSDIDAYVESL